MNKKELYTYFNNETTVALKKKSEEYSKMLAKMMKVDNLNEIIDMKAIIDEILKERENGAK